MSEARRPARAVGASNTLWTRTGGCVRPTPTSKASPPISTPRCRAGTARRRSGRAGRGRLGARGGLWPDRARHRQDQRGQPDARPRAGAARAFGPAVHPAPDRAAASAHPRGPPGQHHLARHDGQPPLEIDLGRCPVRRSSPTWSMLRWRTRCWRGPRPRPRIADGLGMLLHQAVRGFQLWFGVRPEVTPELRALIEADLDKVRE